MGKWASVTKSNGTKVRYIEVSCGFAVAVGERVGVDTRGNVVFLPVDKSVCIQQGTVVGVISSNTSISNTVKIELDDDPDDAYEDFANATIEGIPNRYFASLPRANDINREYLAKCIIKIFHAGLNDSRFDKIEAESLHNLVLEEYKRFSVEYRKDYNLDYVMKKVLDSIHCRILNSFSMFSPDKQEKVEQTVEQDVWDAYCEANSNSIMIKGTWEDLPKHIQDIYVDKVKLRLKFERMKNEEDDYDCTE